MAGVISLMVSFVVLGIAPPQGCCWVGAPPCRLSLLQTNQAGILLEGWCGDYKGGGEEVAPVLKHSAQAFFDRNSND